MLKEHKREVDRATRRATKEFRDARRGESFLQHASDNSAMVKAKRRQMVTMTKIVHHLRDIFAEHILRRTIQAVDYTGTPISGLIPFHYSRLLLQPSDDETEAVRGLAEELVKDSGGAKAGGALAQSDGQVSGPSSALVY